VPTASHDPRTFRGTQGFPEDDFGKNVNDRDYSDDYNAKNKVHDYAAHFNEKALGFDKPVVVSQDGVVLSGNNRTMSSQLAAGKGSDGAYLAALGKRAQKFGFSPEQIERFKHPRVVFRPDGEIPYTVDAFAEFNAQDKKGQDEEGISTKAIQTLQEAQKTTIANTVKTAGGMQDLLKRPHDMKRVFDTLVAANVIFQNDIAKYINMETGKAEEQGKNLLNNIMSGLVLGADNVEGLNRSGMGAIKLYGARSGIYAVSPPG
jgi:hypothetical protein